MRIISKCALAVVLHDKTCPPRVCISEAPLCGQDDEDERKVIKA